MFILLQIVRNCKLLRMLSMRKKITHFTEEVFWEEGFRWDLALVVCLRNTLSCDMLSFEKKRGNGFLWLWSSKPNFRGEMGVKKE